MGNNPEKPVEHYLALGRIEPSDQFISSGAVSTISITDCNTQYGVTIPWNSNYLQKTLLQDQTLKIEAKIWMYYMLERSSLKFIEFSQNQVFYTQLKSTSFVTIITDGVTPVIAQIQPLRIYTDDGQIRMEAQLTITGANMTLESVTFVSSSTGVILAISTSKISTSVYNVIFTTSNDTTALIGTFVVNVTVRSGTATISNRLQFEIYFENIDPTPPTNITMDTVTTVRRSISGSAQTVFGYGQTPYISTALKSTAPQLSEGQQLQVQDAYLCCMSNNGPMPVFNPSSGNSGCTVYDPETMDLWNPLIQSGAPRELSAHLYTPPNARSAVFSFNIDSLTDEKRTCYIHISTVVENVLTRRSVTEEGTVMVNSAALTIQMKSDDTIVTSTGTRSSYTRVGVIVAIVLCLLI